MVKYADDLDATFGALADPTRRRILERLSRGDARVTDLAEPFEISLPAISRHLRVLEGAGLISRSRVGREHVIALAPAPMQSAGDWIDHYVRAWNRQFDSLQDYLKKVQGEGDAPSPSESGD